MENRRPGRSGGAELASVAGLPPDADLVARVRAGDRAAFEVLMRRHNPRVYRAIRAVLRDEAEVEDAMQQAYLLAYAHLGEFAGASSFATWLTRIAVNEALGRLRRRLRLVPLDGEPEGADGAMPTEPNETPEDGAARRELVRVLERAIDHLPAPYRLVVMLRDVEQLSTAEAARALDASEEAVRIRLHRARQALRAACAEELSRGAAEAFPFLAPRCDRVVAAVMAALPGASPDPAGAPVP